jgi:hypothetical protein
MKYKAMSRYYERNRGSAYSYLYRAAMGISAAVRLIILAVAFPFGDREVVRIASSKWGIVLKWALGKAT